MVSSQDFHNIFRKNIVKNRNELAPKLKEMGVDSVNFVLSTNYLNTVFASENYLSCSISVRDCSGKKLYDENKKIKLEPDYSAFTWSLTRAIKMPERLKSIESAERQLQTEALEFAKELEGHGIKVAYDSLMDLAYHLQ